MTGETFEGVVARLRHLAPALLGRDPLDRSTAMRLLGSRLAGAPTAKAALDIALHDLAGRVAGLPVWALLGGRAREALSISRIISPKSPEAMAMDASRHVAAGFSTVKLKIGDARDIRGDVQRVAAVREAVGPDIGIKVDANGGLRTSAGASHIQEILARRAYFSRAIADEDERIASEGVGDLPSVEELLLAERFYGEASA